MKLRICCPYCGTSQHCEYCGEAPPRLSADQRVIREAQAELREWLDGYAELQELERDIIDMSEGPLDDRYGIDWRQRRHARREVLRMHRDRIARLLYIREVPA
jgi:hypothetical protein